MNLKISPYIIGLVKENILYIVFDLVTCALILFFLSFNGTKTIENTQKVNTLTNEVQNLRRRASVFKNVSLSEEDLDSTIKILNELIPNSEDYFSVIYALEKLSQQTNFVINSYTINLKSSTPEKLKLSIAGIGNRDAFLKFLSEYNFGGGRLITSDKIELTPQVSGQIKIDVTFYSKKTSLTQNQQASNISPSLLNDLQKLRQKIQYDLKPASNEGELDLSYPRKTNPF